MPSTATLSRSATAPRAEADDSPDVIERIEAWVASYLDGLDSTNKLANLQDWQSHALEVFTPKSRVDTKAKKVEAAVGWKRLSLSRKHGATIVHLRDEILVRESDIQEFADELTDLIEAGHRRIVLDFGNVDRLSCSILPHLSEAAKRCAEGNLGELRVFNLRPSVVPVVGLYPMAHGLSLPTSESAAVDGHWPGADLPRPLPEALLAGFLPPRPSVLHHESKGHSDMTADSGMPRLTAGLAFCLEVRTGSSRGRKVPVGKRGLMIGREAGCQIRSEHALLSRRHARVRVQGGRVYLLDLGSTNGTLHNGQPVGPEEVQLRPGDQIEVGPLKFSITIDARNSSRAPGEDEIAHWLGPEPDDLPPVASDEDTAYDVPATTHPLRMEVIEDVLVVTPLDPQLLGGADVSVFRDEMAALLESATPHRVVVNLKLSARLSNAAVGVLVAHHMRLDRLGGALRLAEPHVRVAEILNQIRLPLILDVFQSEDEAVLASWGR